MAEQARPTSWRTHPLSMRMTWKNGRINLRSRFKIGHNTRETSSPMKRGQYLPPTLTSLEKTPTLDFLRPDTQVALSSRKNLNLKELLKGVKADNLFMPHQISILTMLETPTTLSIWSKIENYQNNWKRFIFTQSYCNHKITSYNHNFKGQ